VGATGETANSREAVWDSATALDGETPLSV